MEAVEIIEVKADINSFLSGNMELEIYGMGYANLTVTETEVFNHHLSEMLSLLRVGSVRKIRESDGE